MTFTRMTLLATAAVALSVAGCANAASEPSSAPASSTLAPSAVPLSVVPSTGAPSPAARTISGTVIAGVEPNCLLVDDHLLIFNDDKLKAVAEEGTTVTVTGRTEPGMMTTCMQGTPFVVTAIRAK